MPNEPLDNLNHATNIRLTGDANRIIQEISSRLRQSRTQVVRFALATYARLLEEVEEGRSITVEDKKGKVRKELLLPK